MHEINGRDHEPIYRIRAPNEWIWRSPLKEESLSDTTKALAEFIINDPEGIVRITIHNFPSDTLEERIAPTLQIARWQRQFDSQEVITAYTTPQAFSGYTGLLFRGSGILKENDSMVLGWSLQLAEEHYRTLLNTFSKETGLVYRQMRGDVTIKSVGPRSVMEKYESEITAMARSFELIEEIPQRL